MLMHASGHRKERHLFVKRAGWRAGSEVPPDSGARRVVVGGNASMNHEWTMSYDLALKADQERAPKFITPLSLSSSPLRL
jgi:hypothetical protein